MISNVMSEDNLSSFCYTNEALLNKTPVSIVLDFHGLGFCGMMDGPNELASLCAGNGSLYVFPYYGPWSWMNDLAVKYVDEIVSVILKKYSLKDPVIVSSGGSMGGLSALVYSNYAAVRPAACTANCPVCDLPYHFTERPDLPRTIKLATAHYTCGFEQAVRSISPLHIVQSMPDIPYFIIHGTADKSVNKAMHSDRLVEALRLAGKNVTYKEIEGMEHCALNENFQQYADFILSFK